MSEIFMKKINNTSEKLSLVQCPLLPLALFTAISMLNTSTIQCWLKRQRGASTRSYFVVSSSKVLGCLLGSHVQ